MAAAITTTFAGPLSCAQSVGGLTMLQGDAYRIWLNAPIPVPGVTISSCYPPQFMSSFLSQRAGSPQSAFRALVCPSGYATQAKYANNYIACCPSGWDGLALAAGAPADRPASGATCYTNIYNVPITITSYDATAAQAASIFLPTHVSDQAYAYPWEGFAYQGAVVVGGGGAGATATGNGNGATTAKDTANGNSPTATGGSGASNTEVGKGGSTTKGAGTGMSDTAQAANTGSNTAIGSGGSGGNTGGNLPSKTAGGTGNGILKGGASDAGSTSTITTTSSPGAGALEPGKLSSGMVAAIVIGSILALLLLIAIGLFALNYRQRKMAEKKGSVQIDVYNSHYHSHYWWLAPLMSGSNRRQSRDREGGTVVRGTRRWPGFGGRGKEGGKEIYHELEGQKGGHDRMHAELQGSVVERPGTYEMEARITKFDDPDLGGH